MATPGLRAGWEARVGIILYKETGGVDTDAGYTSVPKFFAVKEWSMDPEQALLDANNTEGKPGRPTASLAPGYQSRLRNLRGCKIMLRQAAYDSSADPFAPLPTPTLGFSLREGRFVKVYIWPDRDDSADLTKAHSAEAVITRMKYAGTVGQDQTVTLEMESDGYYNFV